MFAPLPVLEDKSEIHSGVRCQFCVTDSLLSCMSPTDGWHSFCIPSHVTVIPFYYSSFPVTPQSMNEAAPLRPNTWPSADPAAVFLFRLEPISWANDQHRSLNDKISNVNLADKRSMILGPPKKLIDFQNWNLCKNCQFGCESSTVPVRAGRRRQCYLPTKISQPTTSPTVS